MTDHQINKILAEVAGVKVWKGLFDTKTELHKWTTGHGEWTPLTDHNQMALVKAGLRGQGYRYIIGWECQGLLYRNHEVTIYPWQGIPPQYNGIDPDELRAFALAVVGMRGKGK